MEMGKLLLNLEKISVRIIRGIGIMMFFFLCIASLFFTRYFPRDYLEEIPYNRIAIFPITLFGTIALSAGIWWLGNKIVEEPQKSERNLKRLLLAVMAWIFISGIAWILLSHCTPVADQQMVLTSAQRFTEGNYGRLESGKYLFMHPHQLGLTAYEELIFRIFGRDNLTVILIFNVLAMAGAVYSGYQITEYLFQEKRVTAFYLLLAGSCFPFLIYSAYFYGEALAIALSLFSVWQLLRYIKKEKKSSIIFLILGLSAAVLIRSNSLIILIACSCVLAVKGLANKRWQYLFCVVLLSVSVMAGRQGLSLYYEKRCGHELNDGMPMILYVAMGLQEGDKEAGWYNGYNIYIYQDVCTYHGPTAALIGKSEIRARAKEFIFHPGYMLDFGWRKFSSQWSEPTYGCFIMTYAAEQKRGAFVNSVFEGGINRALTVFMDSYQFLIYGMVFILLLGKRRKYEPLEAYALLIAIIGGVLFHMLWEAKSRYVLPYFVMMLPMAAAGLGQACQILQMRRRRRNEAVEAGR